MQVVKDKTIVDDTWSYTDDDSELNTGNTTVSLNRWRQAKSEVLAHFDQIGVRINPADNLNDLGDHQLDKLSLIELEFPDFADGRLFSLAWLLRSRYQYQGELRATGHYMPDQVFYLSRVGVNAFKPEKAEHLPVILKHLDDFTVRYQPSIN